MILLRKPGFQRKKQENTHSHAQEVPAGLLMYIPCCSKYLRNPHVAFQRNKIQSCGADNLANPKPSPERHVPDMFVGRRAYEA